MDAVGPEIFGLVATAVGLAAWTGRYRGWTRRAFGFMVFALLPLGVGLQLMVLGVVTGIHLIGHVGFDAILLLADCPCGRFSCGPLWSPPSADSGWFPSTPLYRISASSPATCRLQSSPCWGLAWSWPR